VSAISYRDVHGIADELGVDAQTVRRWIHSGKLRAFKPGKEYRVREVDLEEFLAAREVRPKAPASSQPSFNGLLEEERHEYPYPWMAGALARVVDYWTRHVQEEFNPAYSRTIAVVCLDVIDAVALRDIEEWERLPETEKVERRHVAERLDALATQGFAHYRASKSAEEAEVREIERRREEIRRRTQALSA
jgi:excisionase family DNA binding protein